MDSKSFRFITHQSFFAAVREEDLEALKNIITDDGSDPSSFMALQNDAGETALYIAAENNFVEIFNYLISFCDLQTVMIMSKADMNAFHVAAARGRLGTYNNLFVYFGGISSNLQMFWFFVFFCLIVHNMSVISIFMCILEEFDLILYSLFG